MLRFPTGIGEFHLLQMVILAQGPVGTWGSFLEGKVAEA